VGVLLLSCALAAINVFVGADSPLLQFFLYGLLWTLQLLVIALYLPYDSLKCNVQNVAVGFATLAHSAIFLGVQRGGVSSGYMIALLGLFALMLVVLLLREKLAANVPWLRVLRHADMKEQEAQIIEAAVELERQLARAPELSSIHNTPRRLSLSAHKYAQDHKEVVVDQEGQPGSAEHLATAATAPKPLTLRVSEEFQRELAAHAQAEHQSATGNESNPASPSLHHRGASVGPGHLFVHRASPSSNHSNGSDVELTRPSPRSPNGAVQLAPLRRRGPVEVAAASVQVAPPDPAVPERPRVRVLPPLRKFAPPTAESTLRSAAHAQSQLPQQLTGEHSLLTMGAVAVDGARDASPRPLASAASSPPL
jgi:hypothetical protein